MLAYGTDFFKETNFNFYRFYGIFKANVSISNVSNVFNASKVIVKF